MKRKHRTEVETMNMMNFPAFTMPENSDALPIAERCDSNLARVLAAGEFAVTGELGPPKGH
ncbi:MAG: hypothetical protein GY933_09955, partial [Hyphomicrobiales bacterium]|nr:hypothetical protein [Hyphomicrobiales bacterium]